MARDSTADAYMHARIVKLLATRSSPAFELREPSLTPSAGAAMLALELAKVPVTQEIVDRLTASDAAVASGKP